MIGFLPPSSSEKSGCTIFANLPVFEIIFTASIVLYHYCFTALFCIATSVLYCNLCFAALFCIATSVLYCNLCCAAEILSLVCLSVKR